jgi:hypothetical protein
VPKAATLKTIQRALEAAGTIFLPHHDVRLRATSREIKTCDATALAACAPMSRRSRVIRPRPKPRTRAKAEGIAA